MYDREIAFRDCLDGLSHTIATGEDMLGPDSEWINGGNVFVQSHPINDDSAWLGDDGIRSLHPSGAMVLFLDGSVHLLNESLDRVVLGQLIAARSRSEFRVEFVDSRGCRDRLFEQRRATELHPSFCSFVVSIWFFAIFGSPGCSPGSPIIA